MRDFVFVGGADLIAQGVQSSNPFGYAGSRTPGFLRRLRTVSQGLPIAAQLEWSVTDQMPTHPD